MAEDLLGNLQAYKLQLQQVEAALTTEPGNEDLQKLKSDLSEVLELTKELIKNQSGTSTAGTSADVEEDADDDSDDGDNTDEEEDKPAPKINWKIGTKCLAKVDGSSEYRECIILEMLQDGQCSLSLVGELASVKIALSALKPLHVRKRPMADDDSMPKSKKQVVLAQKEYKKKKAQKKAQRMKVLEEEREVEKGKWQNFNTKVFSKNKKGQSKRSIFASPDNVNGRVGVGTCGIGGKPMTGYHHQEKWKKNSMT